MKLSIPESYKYGCFNSNLCNLIKADEGVTINLRNCPNKIESVLFLLIFFVNQAAKSDYSDYLHNEDL